MTAKADLINDNGMKLNRYCLTKERVVNCIFYTGTKWGLFQRSDAEFGNKSDLKHID
jgi:hypothetical protein